MSKTIELEMGVVDLIPNVSTQYPEGTNVRIVIGRDQGSMLIFVNDRCVSRTDRLVSFTVDRVQS